MLDNRYAILFIRGERPVLDEKYDILRHPHVRGTADGKAEVFRHGLISGSAAALAVDENLDPALLPETTIPDGDFVLLSEEDLEERLSQEEVDTL